MADRQFMTSQNYDATIGGVVYNVSVQMGSAENDTTGAGTATADDTTPSVLGLRVLILGDNTGATAITQLDDAIAGQVVYLIVTATSNTPTIADSGNFNLSAAWSPAAADTLMLVTSDGTTWYEMSRSDN